MRSLALILTGLLAVTSSTALAGEAESCTKAKVWEAYNDGWSMRSMSPVDVAPGTVKVWKVTAMPGRTYKFVACGDPRIVDLDLVVYDANGQVVARDSTTDRQPSVELTAEKSTTWYVVAQPRKVEGTTPAEIAVAIIWK